jgi:hypothetical protein
VREKTHCEKDHGDAVLSVEQLPGAGSPEQPGGTPDLPAVKCWLNSIGETAGLLLLRAAGAA